MRNLCPETMFVFGTVCILCVCDCDGHACVVTTQRTVGLHITAGLGQVGL